MRSPIELETNNNIKKLEKELELEIENLKHQFQIKKEKLNNEKNHRVKILDEDIQKLKKLNDQQKSDKLKKAITDKNGNIGFWPFFKYMKDRTNDIPNIDW